MLCIIQEGAAEFMAAASAAKKQDKKKIKFGGEEYPVTIKIDIPTEETDVEEARKSYDDVEMRKKLKKGQNCLKSLAYIKSLATSRNI